MSVANYFEKTGVRARAQFQRAGVKPEFWDFMLSIPAEEPRLLSADERRDFRLEGVSPAYSDFEDSREANKLGVSKGEYLARKAAFNSCFNWVMTTNPAGDNWWERCRVRAKLPAD
jgi:hypothetical protein